VKLVGNDENVEYIKFAETFEGLIESQVYHHGNDFESVF